MATRQETRQRCDELKEHLRTVNRLAAGAWRPVPPVRELASKFNLSVKLVLDAQRELVEEGVLHVVPRVGTFIGRPQTNQNVFLMVTGSIRTPGATDYPVPSAFEERIAARGGASLVLEYDVALHLWNSGQLPDVAGVFDWAFDPYGRAWKSAVSSDLPHVRFHTLGDNSLAYDQISFDDVDGGQRATQHLLDLGHRKIAFLAVHAAQNSAPRLGWSAEREMGWKKCLQEAGLSVDGLAWHPAENVDNETLPAAAETAQRVATQFWGASRPSAVVAANDRAAQGLLQFLRVAGVPLDDWPAIVGFDGDLGVGRTLVTSLRLPWDELGRVAADLLWERAHGTLPEQPQHRLVPMKLIPRLTCRTDWSQTAAQSAFAVTAR